MCARPERARWPRPPRSSASCATALARPWISRQTRVMAELRLFGRSAAPGMAEGMVTVLGVTKRPQREAGTKAEEAQALKQALSRAQAEIEALAEQTLGEAG